MSITAEDALKQFEPMVHSLVAKHWQGDADSRDDLEQECRLAIIRAAGSYDPAKGKAITYFWRAIEGAVWHWLRESSRVIRTPRGAYRAGRAPEVIPLDSLENPDDSNLLADPVARTEDEVLSRMEVDRFRRELARLPQSERTIMEGLVAGMSLREIGLQVGLSGQRVHQIKTKIILGLRQQVGPNAHQRISLYLPLSAGSIAPPAQPLGTTGVAGPGPAIIARRSHHAC